MMFITLHKSRDHFYSRAREAFEVWKSRLDIPRSPAALGTDFLPLVSKEEFISRSFLSMPIGLRLRK